MTCPIIDVKQKGALAEHPCAQTPQLHADGDKQTPLMLCETFKQNSWKETATILQSTTGLLAVNQRVQDAIAPASEFTEAHVMLMDNSVKVGRAGSAHVA